MREVNVQVISEVDGVAVIARQAAHGPHPNPNYDTQVEYTGITQLLLADGSEKYACDDDDVVFDSLRSVVSHRASHTRTGRPATNVDTIKAVLRAVKRYGDDHGRYTKAANDLNRVGVRTYHGREWSPGSVRHIYLAYDAVYRVRVAQRKATKSDVSATTVERTRVARVAHDRREHTHESAAPIDNEQLTEVDSDVTDELIDAVATAVSDELTSGADLIGVDSTDISMMTVEQLSDCVTALAESLALTEDALHARANYVGVLRDAVLRIADRLTELSDESRETNATVIEKARLYDEIRAKFS